MSVALTMRMVFENSSYDCQSVVQYAFIRRLATVATLKLQLRTPTVNQQIVDAQLIANPRDHEIDYIP